MTKIKLFGHNDQRYRGTQCQVFSMVVVVASCSWAVLLPVELQHKADRIMENRKIFQHKLKPSTRWLKPGHNWKFQQNNDCKHISRLVVEWINLAYITLKTSPVINSRKQVDYALKSCPCVETNTFNLSLLFQEEWLNIHSEFCLKLVYDCQKCLVKDI